MSSKRSSNRNKDDLKEQINRLSLNLNPQEVNSNNSNNNNQTPLINVYSNITSPKSSSTNSVQKLSELEEKLKEINLGNQNIDGYYKSIKTENQGIIPQIRRMELLQRKMNLLQNSNAQNSKALQEILEIEMKERLRYPKYTIIQNTPLTPHEEIMNQIIEKKLGPANSYSMNYPSVVFKNQNEINEMRNIQNSQNNNNINVNNNINNINNFGSYRVGFQSDATKPVTVKMIKEIQKEVLNLRKTVNDLKIQLKEMKENFKLDLEKDINSNKLLVEIIRKVIEEGGDNKLKSSVKKYFDKEKVNIDEVKTDLEIFKTEELNDIIDKEIIKYDTKMNKILEKMQADLSKLINNNKNNIYKNDSNKNNEFKNNLILVEEKSLKSSKASKKIIEKIISEGSKKSSKISSNKDKDNNLNSKKESEKSSEEDDDDDDDDDEEEEEEEDEEDIKAKQKKSKKSEYSSHKSKSKKSSNKKSSSKKS